MEKESFMDSLERKALWDALCSIHDDALEHRQALASTIKMPNTLCRFRPVSENSLMHLQENKLYYSSADYYDDPFDTFVHVDYKQLQERFTVLSNIVNSDDPNFLSALKALEPIIGINARQYINCLKVHPLDLSLLPDRIRQIRTIIQKNLFSICFCEDELNETLWLKYANNYKGFALVYDVNDESKFLCGKADECKNCRSLMEKPSIYPVYYTENVYDATPFALFCMLWAESGKISLQVIEASYRTVMWEAERVSLIKKKCHEYDREWRMIRPTMMPDRTCIKMKPQKVILGLRMPAYERRLVISAAEIAGISNVEELYINDSDRLDCRSVAMRF